MSARVRVIPAPAGGEGELFDAIRYGRLSRALELLDEGARADQIDEEGETPLTMALVRLPDPRLLERLMRNGASLTAPRAHSAVFSATRGAAAEALEWLAGAGAPMGVKDEGGQGLFHWLATRLPSPSAQKRGLGMAEAALGMGLPLDEPDALGWTPLCLCAALGNVELALWLLERGADDSRLCGEAGDLGGVRQEAAGLSAEQAALRLVDSSWPGRSAELARRLGIRREARELAAVAQGGRSGGPRAL